MLENRQEEAMLKELIVKKLDSIEVPQGLKEEMWQQVKPVNRKQKSVSKCIPHVAAVACLAILITLGLSEIPFDSQQTPSNDTGEQVVNEMIAFTSEEASISTMVGQDWEQVDLPYGNPDSLAFQIEENVFVEIHQSVLQVTTGQPDDQTDILSAAYKESNSYEDFVERFNEKNTQFSGIGYEQLDVVHGYIPVFYHEIGETVDVFALIESGNKPIYMYLSSQDEVESIIETDYYHYFIEMLSQTERLK